MEIERINENTVKFYISYIDIEDRGFDREEIWYNRERSEQLFWQMMEEVNHKEEFTIEGPLWIQVQALDKGLEIIVTKAQLSKDGQNLELPMDSGKTIDMPVDEKIESLLDQKFGSEEENELDDDQSISFLVRFQDFENVIQLSHYFPTLEGMFNGLYHFEDRYYLYVEFENEELDDEKQEDLLSQLLEFGEESPLSIFRIEEYGKTIFEEDALTQIKEHFPQK
ncbi:adaptor protein MecA [Aquibacillus sp. 3ASR75-11]|uniref:Adapter protein MecA n=1 Tax=Terrihalobacillus insolitus TaxID=2950438 RepID=A0A9X3WTA9_9BACI|nr:adaptor protein MecA [Terrihalobacillus insolitus]MDC3413677.1 adaptor protein MecA [Terrihalobacillus insolitus]MDC3425432.1 adaptor protein MecA [Terrihalobacillus insolitus]